MAAQLPNQDTSAQLNNEALLGAVFNTLHGDLKFDEAPVTLEKARKCPNWDKWKHAMDEEMATLRKMNTWELADLPKDRKPISCRWVFALKRNASGEIVKYKARLVARGFSQEYGINYKETFAPVIRLDALRVILALAAIHGWDMQQLDIKGAYLNGELKETIFMIQPPEYDDGTGKVLLLLHSLYGLKQSGRAWYHKFREVLLRHGFEQVAVRALFLCPTPKREIADHICMGGRSSIIRSGP